VIGVNRPLALRPWRYWRGGREWGHEVSRDIRSSRQPPNLEHQTTHDRNANDLHVTPRRIIKRGRAVALLLGVAIAVLVLVRVALPQFRVRCHAPRSNPYSVKDVVSVLDRRGFASQQLPKVRGTRPRSVLLRAAFKGGIIIVYVRREMIQDALPQDVASRLDVDPARAAGVVNVSIYKGNAPTTDTDALTAKVQKVERDLARPEEIPCSDE
jgi:hypothetical protein